jgi:hypothetical protein
VSGLSSAGRERARATWTDERLDDLARRIDDGSNRVDADIRAVAASNDARFDSLERRLDALQCAMIQVGGGMTVAIVGTLVSVLATTA